MPTLNHYKLSAEADLDIEKIFDYTVANFGLDQAISYVSDFEELFERLVLNPDLGRARDEIRSGLKSFPKSSHIVFYRVLPDCLWIVRILHGRQDISIFLEDSRSESSQNE